MLEKNFFKEVDNYLEQKINFHIIGVSYENNSSWKTSGSFNEFDKRVKLEEETGPQYALLKNVDWVVGCAMLINLKKFETRKLFDENIFLYFEEFDLCRRVKNNKGQIFSGKNLLVTHMGTKGSAATDPNYSSESIIFRDWHFMWSMFYIIKNIMVTFMLYIKRMGNFLDQYLK